MIERLLLPLREELRPLVEAKLREELTSKVRAEIECEMRESAQRELGAELRQKADAATSQVGNVFAVQMTAIDETLQRIALNAKTSFESIFDSSGQAALRDRVMTSLNQLVATRIESLRENMKDSLRSELEPTIREEITAQALLEKDKALAREVEVEKDRLTKAFREGLILEHVRTQEIDAMRAHVTRQMSPEVEADLKASLRDGAINQLRIELRDHFEKSETGRLTSELRSKLEAELAPQIRLELISKFEWSIRKELLEKFAPEVEARLAKELRIPLLLAMDGSIEATIGGVLKQNLAAMRDDLRELVLDEIWEKVTGAILGAYAAVADFKEPEWRRYLQRARELIDDRILGSFPSKRRKLAYPDGFYRAVEKLVCTRTKEAILPGDYFLVFRGHPIGLPLSERVAWDLSKNGNAEDEESDLDLIEPPYDGLPWAVDDDDDSDIHGNTD